MKFLVKIETKNLKQINMIERSIAFYLKDFQNVKLVRLPVELRTIVLQKSPHVFKKAKEHFGVQTYKRLFIFELQENASVMYFLNLLLIKCSPNALVDLQLIDGNLGH